MRTGIATLSLSGRLVDKLEAAAAAGFDGVEVFDADLVACPLSPAEVRRTCEDLGLTIDLFQPVRDAVGVRPEQWDATLRRVTAKLDVAAELGAPVVLLCSHVGADSDPSVDRTAEQLRELGDEAAARGLVLAYEALAWGTHVHRLTQAWEAVRRADHPAVTVAVDTFHMLARGDDGDAVRAIPDLRVGFLQVADAPTKDMGLLEWSRHFRCFPGQGTLDVTGVVAATLAAGYDGPVSLEVFSDVVRESDRHRTAADAWRSLRYLEDELAATPEGASVGYAAAAPPPERVDVSFVEVADPGRSASLPVLLEALGFAHVGDHRSKPVQWWRHGGAHVLLHQDPDLPPARHALGLTVPSVAEVSARAETLRWPDVAPPRGPGEAPLPGVSSPGGARLFLSGDAGTPEDWLGDFTPAAPASSGGWRVDHVGVTVAPGRLDEEIGFLRSVLGLVPGAPEEFWEPLGRLRSHALRPAGGDARVVVNAAHGPGEERASVNQVAFACDDLLAEVRRLRAAGVPLMEVPANYYDDLASRTDLPLERLAELREAGVLHDADASGGELLHAYTDVLETGFYVELLERRGGYDGYGSRNTQLRLAVQRRD